jgi:hypothetical protein
MVFFQKCWEVLKDDIMAEVLKDDIMAIFKEFHNRGKFEKSFNATFG